MQNKYQPFAYGKEMISFLFRNMIL